MAIAENDPSHQDAVILSINPDDIEIGERLGVFWPDKAAALGKLIAQDGQNDPIKVRKNGNRAKKPWRLVVGLHRLEGVKMEGLRAIDAIEVWGNDEQLREIEASENVHRRALHPLERASFVRAVADAAEARMRGDHEGLTQQQIAVRARWNDVSRKADAVVPVEAKAEIEAGYTTAKLAVVYGWSAQVAEAMGLSERAMFRDLALHRGIIDPFPTLWRDLAKHPVVGENASALREIVAVRNVNDREKVIAELLRFPALTVGEAKERCGIGIGDARQTPPATGATKFMNNALSNIGRLSVGQQRDFLPALLKALKPSVIDLLEAQIATFKAGGAK
ncbi:MAG: hypothetical protein DI547_16200 [Sphingobium sp.]|nr:MAG: hypothetical protein DI547_16200 [Sphingobium sp.]